MRNNFSSAFFLSLGWIGLGLLLFSLFSCTKTEAPKEIDANIGELGICQSSDTTFIIHPFWVCDTVMVVLPAHWDNTALMIKGQETRWEYLEAPLNGSVQKTIGNNTYTIKLAKSQLNSVFITTESGTMKHIDSSPDKSVKESGVLSAIDQDGKIFYNDVLKQIKGRGNSSWSQEKKPYNIKLAKKEKIFNLKSSKNFCLVSSNGITDYLSMLIAQEFGTSSAIPVCPISLYLNGNYNGLYLITNKVEVAKSSIGISDLEEQNKKDQGHKGRSCPTKTFNKDQCRYVEGLDGPEDITGGYLIEILNFKERFFNTRSGFIGGEDNRVEIKAPEKATRDEVEYIQKFFNEFYDANKAEDGLNPKSHRSYADYIDLTSFAKYYLIEEVLGNMDGGYGNLYFYKDRDSIDTKLYAGPIWDMGWSMGVDTQYPYNRYPRSLFVRAGSSNARHKIFYYLFQHEDFLAEVNRLYLSELQPILEGYFMQENLCKPLPYNTSYDAWLNHLRWSYIPIPDYEQIKHYMRERMDYVQEICKLPTEKEYCHISINAGFQNRNIMFIVPRGTYFTLPEFDYWAPMPDTASEEEGWYKDENRLSSNTVWIESDCFFQLKWKKR